MTPFERVDLNKADLEQADPSNADLARAVHGKADLNKTPPAGKALAVTARNVVKAFGERKVLDGLSLDIAPGEFVALLGRSGCGKTTLLRALVGIDAITSGTLSMPPVRAAVFQEPRLMLWKRAWRNVALGVRKPDVQQLALKALAEVGLAERAHAWPATLSGGEAQRVALARALVREPQLLLLDEPFAALDALTRIRMHQLILTLWQAHLPAVLLVTHDVDEALLLADRILVMADGKVAAEISNAGARPRHIDDPQLQEKRRQLLALLGVEEKPTYAAYVAQQGAQLDALHAAQLEARRDAEAQLQTETQPENHSETQRIRVAA
ncbi:Aliphatic sulfonates import ATP-binding protein SsuB [Andreprevotia sp. IGB-42]|uniref:ABC transporter ATP-binding protein n=1 Tax=Andreprevotia sp. IGB-42 TaxID=2497473 RepID=UPI00135B30B9|nr:ABC transporter ATP-binding protein [Andreprevotia sp. IGB-42]KAF0812639.1 Aliphatic sulfonates import ATP-binding protein SsuB [Andreprevotia sp. IGB-42]